MECVRVILMTSFFSDEINLKMTANNDNRLRGSLPEIITKRIVGECSSSVTDSTVYRCLSVQFRPPLIIIAMECVRVILMTSLFLGRK